MRGRGLGYVRGVGAIITTRSRTDGHDTASAGRKEGIAANICTLALRKLNDAVGRPSDCVRRER